MWCPVSETREPWLRVRRKSLTRLLFSSPALISETLLLFCWEDDSNGDVGALLSSEVTWPGGLGQIPTWFCGIKSRTLSFCLLLSQCFSLPLVSGRMPFSRKNFVSLNWGCMEYFSTVSELQLVVCLVQFLQSRHENWHRSKRMSTNVNHVKLPTMN